MGEEARPLDIEDSPGCADSVVCLLWVAADFKNDLRFQVSAPLQANRPLACSSSCDLTQPN
jgi:hypothetical protein